MKHYKVIWYVGYFDLNPDKCIKTKLKEIVVEAESIDKVNVIEVLPQEEKDRFKAQIKYSLRKAFNSAHIFDAKEIVCDYGNYTKFIYVKEIENE